VIVLLLCDILQLPYGLIPEIRLVLEKQITIYDLCTESLVSDVCNIAGFLKFINVQSGEYFTSLTELRNCSKN